ncbi:uncharacterized protein C1orf105 homolog isoform 3-T3 [Glossophaga mutica]
MGDSKKSTVSVPKFDKVPWLSDGSLRNKPLLLSLPKRYPHASATLLISYKKDTNLPSLFQVPEDSFQARRKPSDPALGRNRQLCAACWEMRMVQQRTTKDPDDRTLSFEAFMSRRERWPPTARRGAQDRRLLRAALPRPRLAAAGSALSRTQRDADGQDGQDGQDGEHSTSRSRGGRATSPSQSLALPRLRTPVTEK